MVGLLLCPDGRWRFFKQIKWVFIHRNAVADVKVYCGGCAVEVGIDVYDSGIARRCCVIAAICLSTSLCSESGG